MNKEKIIQLLRAHVAQRSGIDGRDYGGSREAFMGDYRRILKDGKHARELIRAVELSDITGEALADAFRAYSGRLSLDGDKLSYCAGQYFPTEYRAAACAVCAQALWDHYREDFAKAKREGESDGTAIRRKFKTMFGRAIASRWFD
jgi:hypothetical protein